MSILVEESGEGVLSIVIDRPAKRNAITPKMADQVAEALQRSTDDERIRVVRLSGRGGFFSAGADLESLEADLRRPRADASGPPPALDAVFDAMANCPVPIVCGVEGGALGGAMALAASSTVVIASSRAVFALPEIDLNIYPSGLVPHIARRVGVVRATYWAMTAKRVSANEALLAGLLDEAVAEGTVDERVDEVASQLARRPPEIVRVGMELGRLLQDGSEASAGAAVGRYLSKLSWSPALVGEALDAHHRGGEGQRQLNTDHVGLSHEKKERQ